LVSLAKGRIGEDSAGLLGGLLVTAIGLAAYSRADMPAAARRNFFAYIDEFQSFTTLALANMLSELRKYRVGFTIAHQYVGVSVPSATASTIAPIAIMASAGLRMVGISNGTSRSLRGGTMRSRHNLRAVVCPQTRGQLPFAPHAGADSTGSAAGFRT
jgi:hypothetical protein